jgi:transcriptional regulator with XRE-family HTH domain
MAIIYINLILMYKMDYIKFGERVKEERHKRYLTQEKLAEALDISTSYVGQIERGIRCPTMDTLVAIANIFGLSIDYLLRDSLVAANDTTGEDWLRLTQGKTSEEKKKLIKAIEAMEEYKGG